MTLLTKGCPKTGDSDRAKGWALQVCVPGGPLSLVPHSPTPEAPPDCTLGVAGQAT